MIIDEIKTIASELSDMSPKTQLEIVKLCKNICLKMKDYIVDLDENVIGGINERLDDIESELTVAEGNIQANANAITALQTAIANINTTIGELNTALQTLDTNKVNVSTFNATIASINSSITLLQNQKLNVASIILTGASGTLSSAELTTIQNNTDVIIKHADDTLIKCDVDNGYLSFVGRVKSNIISNQYVQITQDVISINLSTGAWTFTANAIVNTYNKNQLDALLNEKQNVLTAGTGITIQNNVISATGVEAHLYRHGLVITLDGSNIWLCADVYTNNSTPINTISLLNQYKTSIDNTNIPVSANDSDGFGTDRVYSSIYSINVNAGAITLVGVAIRNASPYGSYSIEETFSLDTITDHVTQIF